jgi:hypothetical protein
MDKHVGRPAVRPYLSFWEVNPFDPRHRTTCAHVSICIKRNPNLTLRELANELARDKHRPVAECLENLQSMLDRGHLGYFDDKCRFVPWTPREEPDKCL